jgi:hypothetical protein
MAEGSAGHRVVTEDELVRQISCNLHFFLVTHICQSPARTV